MSVRTVWDEILLRFCQRQSVLTTSHKWHISMETHEINHEAWAHVNCILSDTDNEHKRFFSSRFTVVYMNINLKRRTVLTQSEKSSLYILSVVKYGEKNNNTFLSGKIFFNLFAGEGKWKQVRSSETFTKNLLFFFFFLPLGWRINLKIASWGNENEMKKYPSGLP